MSPRQDAISVEEVKNWIGPANKFLCTTPQYQALADHLNYMEWPADPMPPWKAALLEVLPKDPWNFAETERCAGFLQRIVPAALAFHKEMPDASLRCEIISEFERALVTASALMIHPYGLPTRSEVELARRYQKEWHLPAAMIAIKLSVLLRAAGQSQVAFSRNSMVPRVVHEALKRMGFSSIMNVTTSGVAAYLTRRDRDIGLYPD